ncbi:MAG: YihY/virulence factor BrkB family protein [Metamycoplasmataceae bacterium]
MRFRKNKVKYSWDAIESKQENKKRNKNSWLLKYIHKTTRENTLFEKIVKFLIFISLFISIKNKKLNNPIKRKKIIDLTYDKLSTPGFSFIPAGLGLYLFFSLIPISIIVMSIFSIKPEWEKVLTEDILQRIIPGFSSLIIKFDTSSILENTTVIIFLVTLIWFSSKGFMKFIDSESNIYEHSVNTNFIIKRFRAIWMVIAVSIFVTVSLFTYVPLIILLKNNFGTSTPSYETLFYFSTFFFLCLWSYAGLGLLFRFSPLFDIKFTHITPGILITLIPTVIFTMSFGYISSFIDYDKFGPIGTFLYSIVFVLIFSYFLYAGLIINSSYYKIFYSERIASKKWLISTKIINWFDKFKKKNR